jgi:hypothetical protein
MSERERDGHDGVTAVSGNAVFVESPMNVLCCNDWTVSTSLDPLNAAPLFHPTMCPSASKTVVPTRLSQCRVRLDSR